MKLRTILLVTTLLYGVIAKGQDSYFKGWPNGADPVEVGRQLTERFLDTKHTRFGNTSSSAPPKHITYPDVCTWLGGLWFAKSTDDTLLTKRLIDRFTYLLSNESSMLPPANHVDNSVFGSLPLELYLQTGVKEFMAIGLKYADTQWCLPDKWTLLGQPKRRSAAYGMLGDAHIFQPEQKDWADKGYSWQTRLWLDDMFMIAALQSQAYRVTQDVNYLNKIAREMLLYMDKLQLSSGLFDHAPGAPFRWSRGNGWMAVGFAEVLRILPKNHPDRAKIMVGYKKMMMTLLENQCDDGMWRQLIDDQLLWKETSGTAMFLYAFITGVQQGWLDKDVYGSAARKAWISMVGYINANGDVGAVCEGTNVGSNREHYMSRKQICGDLHGQAPYLWCAYALTR